MIGIYKITNPDGLIYIGKSKDIERRWSEYRRIQFKSQPLLFESLAKYGWVNHIFEVIEECSLKSLDETEKKYIQKFNTLNEGLNLMYPSNNPNKQWIYPEHAKIKKSNTMKEKWKNGEFKRKWAKQVINNETKEVYNTMKECAQKNNISHTKLLKNLGEGKIFSYI